LLAWIDLNPHAIPAKIVSRIAFMKFSRSVLLFFVVVMPVVGIFSGCGTRNGGNLIVNRLM